MRDPQHKAPEPPRPTSFLRHYKAENVMTMSERKRLVRVGLVIDELRKRGRLSVSQLSDALRFAPTTIRSALDWLLRTGAVETHPDPNDPTGAEWLWKPRVREMTIDRLGHKKAF